MNEIATSRSRTTRKSDKSAPSLAAMMLAHRYRLVAPLCDGRVVIDFAGPASHGGALGGALSVCDTTLGSAEIVLALAPLPVAKALVVLPDLIANLSPGGTLVLAIADGLVPALRDALRSRFRAVATYAQRPVLGSIVAPAQFAESRMTALADAAAGAAASCTIVVAGPTPVDLTAGLFETAPGRGIQNASPGIDAAPMQDHRVQIPPPRREADRSEADLRRNAVSLVERLLDLDAAGFALATENRLLRGQLAARAGAPIPISARPEDDGSPLRPELRTQEISWPLFEAPDTQQDELAQYERRPDDDVVPVSRAGDAFFAAHRLLGDTPDFSGALGALNAVDPALRLLAFDPEAALADPPDVSIVIPVFGQLAYTLNCFDGLLRHRSAHRVEIIVVDDVSPDPTGDILAGLRGIRLIRLPANAGFIAACNTGAAHAHGRFVVLLNNDTRVVPGWLDELIDSFTTFPRAGLVGSKLLYPDGTLQEAGGIVWRDGSAWNYGRGDDPNRPCYCHAREVDYVSGASIALPIALWRELGGFDTTYAPAYYEDTDIAFRVRTLGYEVWYQPTSRLIHYEGKTSGTDLASGVKSFQSVNQGKFFYRWRDTLLPHGRNAKAVAAERERQVTRRALLLDDTTPTPRQDAGSNYSLLTMRLFLALGYKLDFVPQDNFLYQRGHTTDLHRIGIECAYAPYFLTTQAFLEAYGRGYDLVMVSRMQVLEKVIGELREFAPHAPIVFNTHDLNFLRMSRAAELAGDAGMLIAAEAMRARELALMRQVDCIITPSAFEGEILARALPEIPTRVLPILTDWQGTSVAFGARRDICFLGGYRHPPNVDAGIHFIDEIFPLLKAAEPDLRFIVAGADPPPALRALARNDIVVTGMIDDLRDLFDTIRVFVCPLRIGAGAKGKVASAMSYGVPIVATSIGAEGMGLADGETVLVADTPAPFAAATLRLYRDRALWESMSEASLALVAEVASAASRERIFTDTIDAALRHKFGVGPRDQGQSDR